MCKILREYVHELLLFGAGVSGILFDDLHGTGSDCDDLVKVCFNSIIMPINLLDMHDGPKALPAGRCLDLKFFPMLRILPLSNVHFEKPESSRSGLLQNLVHLSI